LAVLAVYNKKLLAVKAVKAVWQLDPWESRSERGALKRGKRKGVVVIGRDEER